ncbi:PAAR domain-containing protein [Phyllobacterium sp. CCNWLW183]
MVDPGPRPHVGGPVISTAQSFVKVRTSCKMPKAARKIDTGSEHSCHFPPTPAIEGSPNVWINGLNALRVDDHFESHDGMGQATGALFQLAGIMNTNVGNFKSDTIGVARAEQIGVGKVTNIGSTHFTQIGKEQNTKVGETIKIEVGQFYNIVSGEKYHGEAKTWEIYADATPSTSKKADRAREQAASRRCHNQMHHL